MPFLIFFLIYFFFFFSSKGNLERCWVRTNPPRGALQESPVWGGEVQSRGLVGVFWGAGEPPRDTPSKVVPLHPSLPSSSSGGCSGEGARGQDHTLGAQWVPTTRWAKWVPSTDGQNPSAGDAPGVPRTPVPPLPCMVPIYPPPQNTKEGNEGWKKPTPILPPMGPAPSPAFPALLWGRDGSRSQVSPSPPHPQQI